MPIEVRRKFYKWICYGALMFFSIILQTTLFSNLCVFNASPSFIPFIVATITLMEGCDDGMIAGVAGGFLCDAIYSSHEGFYVIMLPLLAFGIYMMNKIMYWKKYSMAVIDWICLSTVLNIVHYCIFMLAQGLGHPESLIALIPGEIFVTVPFTPFIYMIISRIIKHFSFLDDF